MIQILLFLVPLFVIRAEDYFTSQHCIVTGYNFINNLYARSNKDKSESLFLFYEDNSKDYNLGCFLDYTVENTKFKGIHNTKWTSRKNKSVNNQKNYQTLDGVTIIMFDVIDIGHYYHFLEHLIPLYSILISKSLHPDNVKQIIFPNTWKKNALGKNQMNSKILKALFPHSKIYTDEVWSILTNDNPIRMTTVISSDRAASHKSYLASMWNKMMAPMVNLIQQNHDALRMRLLSQLNLSNLLETKSKSTRDYDENNSNRRIWNVALIDRAGRREMIREDMLRLEQKLRNVANFRVRRVSFQDFGFLDQIYLASNVDIMIGTHGNGLSHSYWMKPLETILVEIFPPNIFTTDYQILAGIKNMRHFAWDAMFGLWRGSEYFLKNYCSNETYTSYGNANHIKSYHISDIDGLVARIVEASSLNKWPVASKEGKLLDCSGRCGITNTNCPNTTIIINTTSTASTTDNNRRIEKN